MNMQPYPEGIDLVWLASDREGHIGAFITAGIGPIPAPALDSVSMPIFEIENELSRLPIFSRAELLMSIKRPDDFIDLAERGIFVYDWTDVGRVASQELHLYEAVAVPTVPATVESLPSSLALLAGVLNIPNLAFAEEKGIDIRLCFTCAEASD